MPEIIIQLISGAIGGNAAGAAMKNKSLGTVWNTVAGLIGGGAGGKVLAALGALQGAGMAGDIGGSAVGGGAAMIIGSLIKSALKK